MRFTDHVTPLRMPRHALVEAIVLPLLLLALGWWITPPDPLFAWSSFPWPLIGPVILALRYGPMTGVVGTIALLGGWLGLIASGEVTAATPKFYFLGALVLVMVCGEFASLWRARVRRAESHAQYVGERLDHLTRQHYLLRASHDRLEQDLISQPMSLRDALTSLRALADSSPDAVLAGADALLKLLAQFCQIERAALFALAADGTLARQPTSTLGSPFVVDANDPLIAAARTHGGLCHVASDGLPAEHHSAYLVVSLLRDMRDIDHGVLIVESMPFFALNTDTLHVLSLLVGYYADSLGAASLTRQIHDAESTCPNDFALELQRMWHIARDGGPPGALVAMSYATHPALEGLPRQWDRMQRALHVNWHVREGDREALLMLIPLAGPSAIAGYLDRLDAWLAKHLDAPPAQFGIALRAYPIDATAADRLLSTVMEDCHVHAPHRPLSLVV